MKYETAFKIANDIIEKIKPYTERAEIAGSVRRKKPECGDIEIVCIRKQGDLFQPGIESVLDKWRRVKGDAAKGKYACRIHPSGMQIDIFFATPENWGLIFFIRTGSAEFSKKSGDRWVELGWHSDGGILYRKNGTYLEIHDEEDVFKVLGWDFIKPEFRI